MSQRLELSFAPKAFLQPGAAREYSIHGIGLGDPVEQLPALRALEPSLSEQVRQRLALGAAGEGLYAGTYGTEAHLERVRATGEGTLVLDADGGDALVVQIARRQVASLHWIGAAVRPLAVTRKAAATARGPTEDVERRHGLSMFTWSASQVALAWNDEAGVVESIALGARPRRWSARDLVRAAVAWEHLGAGRRWPPVSPQPASGALPVQAARLAALVRAFGFEEWSGVELDRMERLLFQAGAAARSSPLDRLHDGSFLLLRPVEEQARARRLILELDPKADLETPTRGERGVLALAWHRLRKLRQLLEATAQVNEDLLMGGGGVFFQAILVANHHAERARVDADCLDRLLGAILDPAGRELTWGALVRDHGWPDEDLEALRVADF